MSFEDSYMEQGAEDQDLATPETEPETGVEVDDLADHQSDGKTSADSRFAEMRRRVEELEAENEDLKATTEKQENALGLYFDGEDKSIAALAQATGLSYEETEQAIREQEELEMLRSEKEQVDEELLDLKVERQMEQDLAELQKLDPSIKSLDDMSETFFDYIGAGLSATDAYFASQQKDKMTKVSPMSPPGEISTGGEAKSYYTKEEVEKMSREQIRARLKDIRSSTRRW